ncbi:type III pantothenate kinase [Persicobacter psychrovividus]|uniref:Type III pantothenate kinase n=1 Tax=Persicobacter psychrovividus TaxID=387638 RepID=A0ABM7VAQ9_9BACT|nr:type III pantothenate kinase [Persicobacter psychrovividus]
MKTDEMINIVLDVGNTRAKLGVFFANKLIKISNKVDRFSIDQLLGEYPKANIIYSSVGQFDQALFHELKKRAHYLVELKSSTSVPFINKYHSPQTLGVDRVAGVCGAQQLFSGRPVLVIDAGSCVTYDLIDAHKVYHGGGISPGWKMRLKAMHEFTAKLPDLAAEVPSDILGKNTVECMQSGAFYGLLSEMREIISHYHTKFNNLQVIMCGGDASVFQSHLGNLNNFVEPDLVLIGLNAILHHNVKEKN